MATVFRVQKTKDFTVMSNHHLRFVPAVKRAFIVYA